MFFLSPEAVARIPLLSSVKLNLKVFFPLKEVLPSLSFKYTSAAAQVGLGLGT